MSKRTIMAVAAGVVAGATVVGVPALAYAGGDSATGISGVDTGSMMTSPAVRENALALMSELMSDPTHQAQMRSMMSDMSGMGGMNGMGNMGNMGGSVEEVDPGKP